MPTEEELKKQQEAEKKAKEEEQRKEKEEEERAAKEKEEEEKLKKIMGDSEAVASILEAKRKANAEAKAYRLELEKLKKEQEEAKKKALKDEGKFKELAEKEKKEKEDLEKKVKEMMIDNALRAEAVTQKIIDPDGVKLADKSKVTIGDDYNVEGAKEAIEALKESKAYLFSEEGGEQITPPPRGEVPNLRKKIAKSDEKITPEQRLENYYAEKKKK